MMKLRIVDYNDLEDLLCQLNKEYDGSCSLLFCDDHLMPSLSNDKEIKGNKTIVFSRRMDPVLTLFTAYKYEPERLHKILFLYLMANRHIEIGNWYNAGIVLQSLKKETTLLPLGHDGFPDDFVFYLDAQAEAMLLHEYGHYLFWKDPDFLEEIKQIISDMIVDSRPGGLKGVVINYFVNKILKNKHLLEELSCDWFAMTLLSERLNSSVGIKKDIESVVRQIVRMFVSMSYFDEILPSKGRNINNSIDRYVFNKLRVGIICIRLNDVWKDLTPELLSEEFLESRKRVRAVRKSMFNKLKYHRMRNDTPYSVTEYQQTSIKNDLTEIGQKILNWYRFSINTLDFSIYGVDDF